MSLETRNVAALPKAVRARADDLQPELRMVASDGVGSRKDRISFELNHRDNQSLIATWLQHHKACIAPRAAALTSSDVEAGEHH